MENLLVDIGNTSVKASFAKGDILESVVRFEGKDILSFIKDLLSSREAGVIAVSSVREMPRDYFAPLEALCNKLVIVNEAFGFSLTNLYRTPQTLGTDRILSALAASALFPEKNCIIFDFGTAFTIDFISAKKEFRGGNISPGLDTRFRSLSDYTHKLPLCGRPLSPVQTGTSTKEAIEAGVVLGLIFEVEGYMNKFKDHIYIFTGGDANYFAEKMKSPIFVVYNLVLMGLARVAKDYA